MNHLPFLKYIAFYFTCLMLLPTVCAVGQQAKRQKRGSVQDIYSLSNSVSKLAVDGHGGAIVDFHLKQNPVNPFAWKVTKEQMPVNNRNGAVFQGHFLCTGRWGAPTDGEIAAGVPHNGQASRDKWNLVKMNDSTLSMSFVSPMDGIGIQREVELFNQQSVFKVTETIKSTLTTGRLFNIVQHATIGAPFLDSTLVVNSNARQGFLQSLSFPDPHRYEFNWPEAIVDTIGNRVDLTRSDTKLSYVSTHLFPDSTGWVVAYNKSKNLLLGYVWKTAQYPWLNLWQQYKEGELWAKGLEFGTCGIGRSYQDLLSDDTRFYSMQSFVYLDARETLTKSYYCFLMPVTVEFEGVSHIDLNQSRIKITASGQKQDVFVLKIH